MLFLDIRCNDVRMIGIYGMGGIGKTTIARVVYDLISCEFEGSSFLADVREICEKSSLLCLQKQLLSELLNLKDSNICNVHSGINMIRSRLRRKKVLLIIDDVVNLKQLESLVGHDWFGSGSRIIITSRDKHLLMTHRVDGVYKLEKLNDDEANQLFCINAFKAHQPVKEYRQLLKCVLNYTASLPLALKALGSFLYGRTIEEWKSALQRLKRDPMNQIMQILQISFDGLQDTEKQIFLDIACFFKGKNKEYVIKILEGCDLDPIIGICVLIEKSLVYILDDNRVWMHDLLQEMGQQIVKRESKEPGKYNRLWEEADVCHVLSENTGTEVIEGIVLNHPKEKKHSIAYANAFSRMINLRLLKIRNVQLPYGLEYLSNELRLLEWYGYPLESLPSNLQLEKTVELSMCYSNMKQMLNVCKPLNNLKFMRFSHCKNLTRTPDFTVVPNLEELILEGCIRLCEIHSSLLLHKKVILLNLKDCTSLRTLPSKIAMESLRELVLSGCLNLRNFPDIAGSMKCLSQLLLDGTAIKELPLSVALLSGLVLLNLKECTSLTTLPSKIAMESLSELVVSGCSKLGTFAEIVGNMGCLSRLLLDGTAIKELPLSVALLSGLVLLNLKDCKNLKSLPSAIFDGLKCLKTLNLSGCSKLENVPENLREVGSLEELDISGTAIRQLASYIFLPKNLKALSVRGCKGPHVSTSWFSRFPNLIQRRGSSPTALMLPSLSGLPWLKELDLSDCNLGEGAIPIDICNLFSLEKLILSKNSFVSLPGTINRLSKLKSLELEDCKRLVYLQELPSSIEEIRVDGCASLERVSDALKSCKSEWLGFSAVKCLKLVGNNDWMFSVLRGFLEVESTQKTGFWFAVPGSKIPEWFKYKNEGPSITIIKPPNAYYNKNKLLGYIFCSVFHVHKHPPINVRSPRYNSAHVLVCGTKVDRIDTVSGLCITFIEELGQAVSDHLWLFYLPIGMLCEHGWNFGSNHVELFFWSRSTSGAELEVKRCGVHPVYVDEVEEFNQTTKEWTRSKVWNLSESDCIFDVATTTVSKRSLVECAGAEASDVKNLNE
ncbi:Disease resistance protein [Melia azedarach]|uniref:Disease resistance protein n=2 Tax=Melia azedarach TaxID=155640 RepID=A0ACC1X1Z4_MELAZ|nr:Disease resistance protein [Melia azedarach]KAJ4705486.1 Disease resistance protein [Melia azedarach]